MMKKFLLLFLLPVIVITAACAQTTYTNPLKQTGPDPWVWQQNGWYYYMNTIGSMEGHNELKLWRTKNMANLRDAENITIFKPEDGLPYSKQLWAPEIHFLQGKWYVYFAADNGDNRHHRMWVLENASSDPFEGKWTLKGKLTDPGDHWAIDLTVIEYKGKLFAAWSGWEHYYNIQQNLYLAELENPWTMKGDRVLLAKPEKDWELQGKVPIEWQRKTGEPPFLKVLEGPQFLQHNDRLFIIYSANACWTNYNLGLLELKGGDNLMDAKKWKKYPTPVFSAAPENGVYAPGHNGFFKSPDGKEDWIIYHANPGRDDGCGEKRAPNMQRFYWTKNGFPVFGKPVGKGPFPVPSGSVK